MLRPLLKLPMFALHGPVTHGPHRAKHLHNFHQAQPLGNGIDTRRFAQLRLKRHTSLTRQRSACIGAIREVRREIH